MKISSILKVAVLALPLFMASCHVHKKAVKDTPETVVSAETQQQTAFLEKVNDNTSKPQFVTSKLKFSIEYGPQQVSLTGNLKMKRDDVIQLQLMAFGFVEAGRIEFTKDYVLIIDRINKQFLKAPYNYVDFLRNSGINFFTLQALFWNELFVPGRQSVDKEALEKFSTNMDAEDVVITLDEGKMNYSWLANNKSGRIKMANIAYRDQLKGNTQLNWDYKEFTRMGSIAFPSNMGISLTTPESEIKLGIRLNYLKNESDWATRTKVSDKYREVTVDQILRRFMAL
ncbi:DUF4292 domain-containing protein [Prevotella sp. E15-22]|jgi:hypothetical protein|uniref:DUF4292 domain-containing protein n=1 Tax=Prevotella sp. E15-22 TaxID=2937774 RepID=UPI002061EB0E|nr:DUF4292 domain-containing protein [Prevotella sp. E15-22]UPS44323.1 DUF4292 domain-containing protein [Prevotella sp. E15-22]